MNREEYVHQNTARMEKILGSSAQSGLTEEVIKAKTRKLKKDETIRKRAHPVTAFFRTVLHNGMLPISLAAFALTSPFLGTAAIFPGVLYFLFLCLYFFLFVRREKGMVRHENELIAEVRVIRDGRKCTVSPEKLLVGDLLLLSPGDVLYTHAHVVTDDPMMVYCRRDGAFKLYVKHGGDCFDECVEPFNTLCPGDVIKEGEGRAFVTEKAVDISLTPSQSRITKNHGDVCALATRCAYLISVIIFGIAFFRTCVTADYVFLAKSLLLSIMLISTAGCSFYPLFFDLLFLYRNKKTSVKTGGAFLSVADMEALSEIDSYVLSTRSMFRSARYTVKYFESASGKHITDMMRPSGELSLLADSLFALRRKSRLTNEEEAVFNFCNKHMTGKRVQLCAKTAVDGCVMTSYRTTADGQNFSFVWGDAEQLIPHLVYLSENGKTRVFNGKLRDSMMDGVLRLQKTGYRFLLLAETQARITQDSTVSSLGDMKLLGFFALRRLADTRAIETLERIKSEEKKIFFVHDGESALWLKKEIRLFEDIPIIDGRKETFREELAYFVRGDDLPFCIGVHLSSVQRAQVVSALKASGRRVAAAGRTFEDHRMMRAATAAIAPSKSESEDVPLLVLDIASVRASEHVSAQVETVEKASGILGTFGTFSAALCASLLGRCVVAFLGMLFGTIYLSAEYYALLSIVFDLLALYSFLRIESGTIYYGTAGLVRENRKNFGFFAGFLSGSLLIGAFAVYVAFHRQSFAFTPGSLVFVSLLLMLNVGIWRFSSTGKVTAKLLFPLFSSLAIVFIFVAGYLTEGQIGFDFHAEILFWALIPIVLLLAVGKVFEVYFKQTIFFGLGENNERV